VFWIVFYLFELVILKWLAEEIFGMPILFWAGVALGIVMVAINGVANNERGTSAKNH
jgi:hypothetical protein